MGPRSHPSWASSTAPIQSSMDVYKPVPGVDDVDSVAASSPKQSLRRLTRIDRPYTPEELRDARKMANIRLVSYSRDQPSPTSLAEERELEAIREARKAAILSPSSNTSGGTGGQGGGGGDSLTAGESTLPPSDVRRDVIASLPSTKLQHRRIRGTLFEV